MQKTLEQIRRCVSRNRAWIGVFLIFAAGAFFTFSACVYYFNGVLESQGRSYNRQIKRLTKDVDFERNVNRIILSDLVRKSDRLTDDIGRLATDLDELSEKVGQTATTASQAANTAKAAAKNAANANIKITEVKPGRDMRLE